MRIFNRLLQSLKSSHLKVGDFIKETRIITQKDVDTFSDVSGDHNPIHKKEFCDEMKTRPIVHGALLNGIVSGIIGTKFPGPGTLVLTQEFTFPKKCYPDEEIEVVIELLEARKIMKVRYEITQSDQLVFEGIASLLKTQ